MKFLIILSWYSTLCRHTRICVQVFVCSSFERGHIPALSNAMDDLLITLRTASGRSNTSTSGSLLLESFINSAANFSGTSPTAVDVSLQVGVAVPAPSAQSNAGSQSSAAALQIIVIATCLAVLVFALLCVAALLLMFRYRNNRLTKELPYRFDPSHNDESCAAEIGGVNPMLAVRTRGVGTVVSSPRDKAINSAATSLIGGTSSLLTNPMTALKKPVLQSHSSARNPERIYLPATSQREVIPLGGSLISKDAPKRNPLESDPSSVLDDSVSALQTYKYNPLHQKRSRGSSATPAIDSIVEAPFQRGRSGAFGVADDS